MESINHFSWLDVLLVSPALVLFFSSLIPLLSKIFNGNRETNSFSVLASALAGVVTALGLTVTLGSTHKPAFDGMLQFDGVSFFVSILILLITGASLIFAKENTSSNNHQFSEFVFLLLNSAVGMLTVLWANDLMVFFIGMELMSLCLYILIALSSEGKLSKEASLKYFILGSFASAILLYGVALIYGMVGSTQFSQILESARELILTSRIYLFGVVFVILGLCFKVSLFPFQAWTPDVYQGSPSPVTAFMATGVKTVCFVVFLKTLKILVVGLDSSHKLIEVLQWIAALTMLLGNIAALVQNNVKRMLAYSSISHSGYILIGLIVSGVSGDDFFGSASILFYLASYSIMTLGAFGIVSILEKNYDMQLQVQDLSGLGKRSPWLAGCFTLVLLSLGGIPPTVGFFAKFYIFSAALKYQLIWLAIWGVLSSIISIYYYLRPIVFMYMKNEEGAVLPKEKTLSFGVISASMVLILVFGVMSQPLFQWIISALGVH
ncbi:MAG: NADH-quinone oxidoreductase subunit N [Bdellovibrionales bacterium]|nr:NADH-quinone oxidoreductase subunit N [Bdellovibrionales bacterium]